MRYVVAVFIVLVLLTAATAPLAAAAENEPALFPLSGRHAIWIRAGLLSSMTVESSVVDGSVTNEVRDNGPFATLAYAHFVNEDWSAGVELSFIDAGASTSVEAGAVTSEAASVTAILFGAAYYPHQLAITPALRPYAAAAFGPYIGSAANSTVGANVSNTSVSDTVIGLRTQIGVDVFFARRFTAGVSVGYDFVGTFSKQIGNDDNYSGPQFSLGAGILLGSGR